MEEGQSFSLDCEWCKYYKYLSSCDVLRVLKIGDKIVGGICKGM